MFLFRKVCVGVVTEILRIVSATTSEFPLTHLLVSHIISRHYAEHSGYFEKTTFVEDAQACEGEINFYDSNTGNLLFTAPKGRSMDDFLKESRAHGWPSFRGKQHC